MTRINSYRLNDGQRDELLRALKTEKRADVLRRANVVYLLHVGYGLAAVEQMRGVDRVTAWNWHKRFIEEGIEGLHDKQRQGRPTKVTDEYIEALQAALASSPARYGYDFAIWTQARLLEHLYQQTGIQMSLRTLGGLMHGLGYVYREPTTSVKHLQDPQAVEQAQANLEVLKGGRVAMSTNSSLWTRRPASKRPISAAAG
jgi:transposase